VLAGNRHACCAEYEVEDDSVKPVSAYHVLRHKCKPPKYLKKGCVGRPAEFKCAQLFPDYTPEEIRFMMAMDAYKRRLGRHLTNSDVFRVAWAMGYRKVL
jgi:hypothetical protein